MKRKFLALFIVLVLLSTYTLSWADVTLETKKLDLAVHPEVDGESLVLSDGATIYLTGINNTVPYLVKYDKSLKEIWRLKLSSVPSHADIYGGYLYAISHQSIFKVSLDGKLVWEKKIPQDQGNISPGYMIVAGNQLFASGFDFSNTAKSNVFTLLCDTDGKKISVKKFDSKSSGYTHGYYFEGAFYFDQGEDHFVSTSDNVTFEKLTENEFFARYNISSRFLNSWFSQFNPINNGLFTLNAVSIDSKEVIYSKMRLNNVVVLSDHSLFGIGLDSKYTPIGFLRTQPLAFLEQEMKQDVETPVIVTAADVLKVVDHATLRSQLKAIMDDYNSKFESKAESRDNIALYLETVIAKLTSIKVANQQLVSPADFTSELLEMDALSTTIDDILNNSSIATMREIRGFVTLKLTEPEASITLSKALADLPVAGLIIDAPEMNVRLDANHLAALKAGDLTISFGLKDGKVSFEVSRPLDTAVVVILPKLSGNADGQTIFDANGKNLGGKYNDLTGMLETRVKGNLSLYVGKNTMSFKDISWQSEQIKEAISVLSTKGIMGGTSETTFAPDALINRAEIAAMLLKITCTLENEGKTEFTDVKASDWFYNIAYSAKKNGIMGGTRSDLFSPKRLISKEELYAILMNRLKNDLGYGTWVNPSPYSYMDLSSISPWAESAIELAMDEAILVNYRDGFIDPKSNLTRGEAAEIIYAFYKKFW